MGSQAATKLHSLNGNALPAVVVAVWEQLLDCGQLLVFASHGW